MVTHRDRTIAGVLAKYGFSIVRSTGKHYVARAAGGAQVVVAKTPSDHRAYHNIESNCRRALREKGITWSY